MRAIAHLNTHYRYWFPDEAAFRERLSDVFFVAQQQRLDADFEFLKRKLGLPPEARLPSDPIAAHRSLHDPEPLSEVARSNLERWYASDLAFVQLCRELAPMINADEAGARRTATAFDRRLNKKRARLPLQPTRSRVTVALAFLLLIAVPEALGDRPFDPIGKGSILERVEHG
jgi:hypothetical protein